MGNPCRYRPMTLLTTRRRSIWGLRVVHRHPSRGRQSKLDGGLCLRPQFRQQAVPVNHSKNLVTRATQVFRHSIRVCVLSHS